MSNLLPEIGEGLLIPSRLWGAVGSKRKRGNSDLCGGRQGLRAIDGELIWRCARDSTDYELFAELEEKYKR